jgi:3-dehydroquinate dehydratase-2
MKLLLMNGPNLNLLGQREPDVYGTTTLDEIEAATVAYALDHGAQMDCFQSNHEGLLIDKIQESQGLYDGIVYNPGAHTHYSYAIHDAISSVTTPVVEVHISDIAAREEFRRHSVLADACIGQIKGLGPAGYLRGVDMLIEHLKITAHA